MLSFYSMDQMPGMLTRNYLFCVMVKPFAEHQTVLSFCVAFNEQTEEKKVHVETKVKFRAFMFAMVLLQRMERCPWR